MAIRPKVGQRIIFRQSGERIERTGVIQSILSPKYQRHLKRTEYVVICDDNQEKIFLDSIEIQGYAK
jgi:hypothetical protein